MPSSKLRRLARPRSALAPAPPSSSRSSTSGPGFKWTSTASITDPLTGASRAAESVARALRFGGSHPATCPSPHGTWTPYLTWGEPPQPRRRRSPGADPVAEQYLSAACVTNRLHTISRDTSAEAWRSPRNFERVVSRRRRAGTRSAPVRVGGPAARDGAARRAPDQTRDLPEPGPGSARCAAEPAPLWSAATRRWRI